MKAQLLIFLALSALIMLTESAANPYISSPACDPNDDCPSYCTYDVNKTNNLVRKCIVGSFEFDYGGCLDCDPLFFTLNGTFCIPHGLRNEYKANYTNYRSLNYRLGWYLAGTVPKISKTKSLPIFKDLIT